MKKLNSKVQFSISDTPLPHNFIAEKIILSCLLINYEAIEVTIKTVRVETFYFINHQEIYKAIVEMYRKKLTINVFSVNDFLKETGCLDKIGGQKVLLELLNQIPNLVYLEEYIQLIQDKFLRRSLINLGYEVNLTEKAKDFIADKGYDPQYGARPLNRAIQKYLEDLLAEEILKGPLEEGELIEADYEENAEQISLVRKKV